jgi:hypothetical protein
LYFATISYILEKILKNDRYDKAISQASDEYQCDQAKIVKIPERSNLIIIVPRTCSKISSFEGRLL